MKIKTMYRAETFEAPKTDDLTLELSFSSEAPVDRYFGEEVLSHEAEAVNLSRLNNAAPLLWNHNPDRQIGVVEGAKIDGGKGVAKVRFSPAEERIINDVKSGIIRNVSVGYKIQKMDETEKGKYRATAWEPVEISLVSIPADPTVGVGRGEDYDVSVRSLIKPEEKQKTEKENQIMNEQPKIDVAAERSAAAKTERARIAEISALGREWNMQDQASKAVEDGTSLDDFRCMVLENGMKAKRVDFKRESAEIGMSKKEKQNFSLFRAVQALIEGKRELAPFEMECSRAVADRIGRSPEHGFFVPEDVMGDATRDLNVTTGTAGGNMVQTDLLAGSMIDILRNSLVTRQLGATYLEGLVGSVAIPKQSGSATAYWVAEGNAPTESQQTIAQVTLSPKNVGAYTDATWNLLRQSSVNVENFVRRDIMLKLAEAIDTAAINGQSTTTKTNEPVGILNSTEVADVTAGTSAASAALTWADIVNLETEVAQDNAAFGRLAYLTNAKVRGKLKQTLTSSLVGARYIWDVNAREINGYPAMVSNLVPSNLAQASTSLTANSNAIIFGNWADMIIGMWGGIEIMTDPYSLSTSFGVRIVARAMCDIKLRHGESFAKCDDVSV